MGKNGSNTLTIGKNAHGTKFFFFNFFFFLFKEKRNKNITIRIVKIKNVRTRGRPPRPFYSNEFTIYFVVHSMK